MNPRADSEVEVFVNGASAGMRRFTPASLTAPDPVEFTAPARAGANAVRIVTRGGGAIYWAAQATYYDTAAAQERTGSRALALQREYFSLTPVTVKDRIVYRESAVRRAPPARATCCWCGSRPPGRATGAT